MKIEVLGESRRRNLNKDLAARINKETASLPKLSLQHKWEVVQAKKGDPRDYGSVKALLAGVCAKDGGSHPFVGGLARPLTFKETVQARLDQYEQYKGKDLSLWTSSLDSCSAIAYKANSTKFKIIPVSDKLLDLEHSRDSFVSVRYDDLPGDELDTEDDDYSEFLTFDQVVKHKGWLAVMENDGKLLRRYAEVAFAKLDIGIAMSFVTSINPRQNQLRALSASSSSLSCNCYGYRSFNYNTRFARMSPP